MVTVKYGGKSGTTQEYIESNEYLVVRSRDRQPVTTHTPFASTILSTESRSLLNEFEPVFQIPDAGVEVLRAKTTQTDSSLRDRTRTALDNEENIEFAGTALVDPVAHRPVVYTENLFIKFQDSLKTSACEAFLQQQNLTIKRQVDYAQNAYFVAAPVRTGIAVFDLAEQILQEDQVELCHPELISEMRSRTVARPTAFPQQWHLKSTTVNNKPVDASANVEAAWSLSTGEGVIISVIDTGFDLAHEELALPGKIVAPRDATRQTNAPEPTTGENHGTSCAGVACAAGIKGAAGVAPGAKLIPIRLASNLGSQAEAESFSWAARNGAAVISCSWGPPDGDWSNPNDPTHNRKVALPDSTRLAIDFAATQGRNGKGCVICFAAGNGNESVDNDGYASYEKVIAVAASNDRNKRSAYSDYGNAVWCAFPSNDVTRDALTPGIWTCDRSGNAGYNRGNPNQGDSSGNYTNSFGGTSSACPGLAGVAALIIACNPELTREQVRDILKQASEPIDPEGGRYDASGRSPYYGYGRINALKAVQLAASTGQPAPETPVPETPETPAPETPPTTPNATKVYKVERDTPIPDMGSANLDLSVPDSQPIKSLKVAIDIEHSYIGDLIVTLKPPSDTGVNPIVLHNRSGESKNNLHHTYDAVSNPELVNLTGKNPQGTWTLDVADQELEDTGKIRSVAVELELSES